MPPTAARPTSFIVLDTEGAETLTEIAIVDAQAKVIYEATLAPGPDQKNLSTILKDFSRLQQGQRIICHNAQHDEKVLRQSFQRQNLPYPNCQFGCTWELAHQVLPNLTGYSLKFLASHLQLRVEGKLFNEGEWHGARYDALFTYELYQKLRSMRGEQMLQASGDPRNPFSSNRVDNPFQTHLDLQSIYEKEFLALKSLLGDISQDVNRQSLGAVVIGNPGSGKTHLMMRLAREVLQTNRVLYIPQPNNAAAVLYHIYTKVNDSLSRQVPGSEQTQLDRLLMGSLVAILEQRAQMANTQRHQDILNLLQSPGFDLYSRLGQEDTDRHRSNWDYIGRQVREWWSREVGAAGLGLRILDGIVKFCSYVDPRRKDLARRWLAGQELEPTDIKSIGLENWQEDVNREEFALEAISVLARLAILDQPLVIAFDQLEGLGLEHNRPILQSFGEAIKELLTRVPNCLVILNLFPDRWQQFQSYFDGSIVDRLSQCVVHLQHPNRDQLQQILALKLQSIKQPLNLFSPNELEDIIRQPSIRGVITRASAYFKAKLEGTTPPRPGVSQPLAQIPVNLPQSDSQRLAQVEETLRAIARLLQPYLETATTQTLELLGTDSDVITTIPTGPDLTTYFEETRQSLAETYDIGEIVDEYDDIGKLDTIINTLKPFYTLETEKLPERYVMPEHFIVKKTEKQFVIGFLHRGGSSFTRRLENFNAHVQANPEMHFYLLRDQRMGRITGARGVEELDIFKTSKNATYREITREERLQYELIYATIIAVQEQDLEVTMGIVIDALRGYLKTDWMLNLLTANL